MPGVLSNLSRNSGIVISSPFMACVSLGYGIYQDKAAKKQIFKDECVMKNIDLKATSKKQRKKLRKVFNKEFRAQQRRNRGSELLS